MNDEKYEVKTSQLSNIEEMRFPFLSSFGKTPSSSTFSNQIQNMMLTQVSDQMVPAFYKNENNKTKICFVVSYKHARALSS